jgi:hypothetical protein
VTAAELTHGIPLFLDQLIKTLEVEQTSNPMLSRKVSGPAGGGNQVPSEMGAAAALHGRELLQHWCVRYWIHIKAPYRRQAPESDRAASSRYG